MSYSLPDRKQKRERSRKRGSVSVTDVWKNLKIVRVITGLLRMKKGWGNCIHSEIQIVFVLYGDISSIGDIVSRLKKAGKDCDGSS